MKHDVPDALDRIADRIEADEVDVALAESVEDPDQVAPAGIAFHVDVDLLVGERGPDGPDRTVGERDVVERRCRTRSIDHRLLGCVRHLPVEHVERREEHRGMRRLVAMEAPVGELGRVDRDVVDDQVGDDVDDGAEVGHVGPRAEARVDTRCGRPGRSRRHCRRSGRRREGRGRRRTRRPARRQYIAKA